MEIRNSFTVPLAPAETWAVLLDIPRIAPCMPGARLTAADPEAQSYEGEVQVRLGPVMLTFAGKARIVETAPDGRSARVQAEGRDRKGRGGASAEVAFRLTEESPGQTRVDIDTQLNLSGSIAQYGRSSGMVADLANHLVGQFAANLHTELDRTGETARAAAETPVAAAPASAAPSAAPISGFRLGLMLLWRRLRRLFGGG
jgi:carbon monoxide dehydrogenase subunit G